MHLFKDSKDATWELRITAGTVKRCAEYLGVDIGNPTSGTPSLLTRFDSDIAFMVNVLFCVLKPKLDEKGVTDEQFAELLEGDALQAAHDAFLDELLDFFLSLRRADMAEAIRRQRQIVARGVEAGRTILASDRTTEAIEQALSELTASAANLLVSSVSTPTPEPSAS
jgi:hypothetical protein